MFSSSCYCRIPSVNCIPSQSPGTRRTLATIAIGPKAIQDPMFYSSLHQKRDDGDSHKLATSDDSQPDPSYFSGTAWNLVRSEAQCHTIDDPEMGEPPSSIDVDSILKQIQEFTDDITTRVKENAGVAQGMKTFLRRYHNLTQNGKCTAIKCSSSFWMGVRGNY